MHLESSVHSLALLISGNGEHQWQQAHVEWNAVHLMEDRKQNIRKRLETMYNLKMHAPQ
jgi:hypothetical protein